MRLTFLAQIFYVGNVNICCHILVEFLLAHRSSLIRSSEMDTFVAALGTVIQSPGCSLLRNCP